MIDRRQVMGWLAAKVPKGDLLVTLPAHVFLIDEFEKRSSQVTLAR
jgi:hypothetical protein